MGAFIDLTGQTFGDLYVLNRIAKIEGRTHYLCRCLRDGNELEVESNNLKSGHTASCGCRKATLSGASKNRAYNIWACMHLRCNDPSAVSYAYCGARGIRVCERWCTFFNFYLDMGDPPPGTSLDRIDNNAGYRPDNCRWATRVTQQRNTRRNRMITYCGETKCLAEWSEITGIGRSSICKRLDYGWGVDRAFTQPTRAPRNLRKKVQKP